MTGFRNPHSHIGVKNLQGVQIVVRPSIMGELHGTSNFISVLDILAEQFNFSYDFLQLGDNRIDFLTFSIWSIQLIIQARKSIESHFGLYQVFCRLQTFPIVTVPAMGATLKQAKQAAAHQALEALVSVI